jgi:hypothetical protein
VAESGAKRHRMAAEYSLREVQRGCRMVSEKPQSGHREAQGETAVSERLQTYLDGYRVITEMRQRG